MAGGFVEPRVDPVSSSMFIIFLLFIKGQGLSQRERHLLHVEVIALQETLGISYKDAAHRLFMAEVERIKKADSAAKNFGAVRQSMASMICTDIMSPILAIDKGELDGYVLKDGEWCVEAEGWEE